MVGLDHSQARVKQPIDHYYYHYYYYDDVMLDASVNLVMMAYIMKPNKDNDEGGMSMRCQIM
jgi:hypothetical protein